MSDNIQTNTTRRFTPCLQQKIDKTRYLVEVHFSNTSIQNVEDKLKRVIFHDLEHGKQGRQSPQGQYGKSRRRISNFRTSFKSQISAGHSIKKFDSFLKEIGFFCVQVYNSSMRDETIAHNRSGAIRSEIYGQTGLSIQGKNLFLSAGHGGSGNQ